MRGGATIWTWIFIGLLVFFQIGMFWRYSTNGNWEFWGRPRVLTTVESVNVGAQLLVGLWVSRWEENSWVSVVLFILCTIWSLLMLYALRPSQDYGSYLFFIVCALARLMKVVESQAIYACCVGCWAVGVVPLLVRPRRRESEEHRERIRLLEEGHRESIRLLREEHQAREAEITNAHTMAVQTLEANMYQNQEAYIREVERLEARHQAREAEMTNAHTTTMQTLQANMRQLEEANISKVERLEAEMRRREEGNRRIVEILEAKYEEELRNEKQNIDLLKMRCQELEEHAIQTQIAFELERNVLLMTIEEKENKAVDFEKRISSMEEEMQAYSDAKSAALIE